MREITYVEATREAVINALQNDQRVFVIGQDVGAHGGVFHTTAGLRERFGPTRIRDAPSCQRGIVGFCIGAAVAGARPILDLSFADYLLYGVGELAHQLAVARHIGGQPQPLPLVIRVCTGIGLSSGPFHSGNYHNIFAQLPGLRVAAPATPHDGKGMLAAALAGDEPVVLLEHKLLLEQRGPVPEADYQVPLDCALVVREGEDLTIVAYGGMLARVAEAADRLADDDYQVEIVDLRSLAPLDMTTLVASVAKTGRILLVDDAFPSCSISAEIACQLAGQALDYLDAPIERLAARPEPPPYSPALEVSAAPGAVDVIRAARRLMEY
jgi:2-oxoisovalerate dehydrogenase E1 component